MTKKIEMKLYNEYLINKLPHLDFAQFDENINFLGRFHILHKIGREKIITFIDCKILNTISEILQYCIQGNITILYT